MDNSIEYHKIYNYIREQIADGRLVPGGRLAPLKEIARIFNISQRPVQMAVNLLSDEGVLEKVQGRGTFLREDYRGRVTGRIAVLHSHDNAGLFSSSYYTSFLAGAETELQAEKKSLLIRSMTVEKGSTPASVVEDTARDTDGLILLDPAASVYDAVAPLLPGLRKPVVTALYGGDPAGAVAIGQDYAYNTGLMVDFLRSQGHRRIGFIYHRGVDHPTDPPCALARLDAYRQALQAHGIEPRPEYVQRFVSESGRVFNQAAVLEPLLRLPERPTVLLCATDEVALFIYVLLKKLGFTVPGDMAVAGMTGIAEGETAHPALTTIQSPVTDMGRQAARLVLGCSAGQGDMGIGQANIRKGSLVIRQSHLFSQKS